MASRIPFTFAPGTSATTTSKWFLPDYRFDANTERAFAGKQGSGGNIFVQVAVSVADALARNSGGVNPSKIFTLSSTITSTTFDGVIHGSWGAIRFIAQGGDTTASLIVAG